MRQKSIREVGGAPPVSPPCTQTDTSNEETVTEVPSVGPAFEQKMANTTVNKPDIIGRPIPPNAKRGKLAKEVHQLLS